MNSLKNGDFAKILIQGHQYATLGVRSFQDLSVSRILKPLACPHDVMSATFKELLGTTPDTRIQKKFHCGDSTRTNSTRSCPMTLRA